MFTTHIDTQALHHLFLRPLHQPWVNFQKRTEQCLGTNERAATLMDPSVPCAPPILCIPVPILPCPRFSFCLSVSVSVHSVCLSPSLFIRSKSIIIVKCEWVDIHSLPLYPEEDYGNKTEGLELLKRLILWALGLLVSCDNRSFPLLLLKFQGVGGGSTVPVREIPIDICNHYGEKASEPRICLDSICYTSWRIIGLLNFESFQRRCMNNSFLHLSLSDRL